MAVLALGPVSPGHRECPVPGFRLMLCVLPASGAGTGVRDTGTPVLVDTPEAPQAGTAKNECLLPSHGCSQPALLLTLPRPGSEPVRQESPHPRTSVSSQPGKGRPCSSHSPRQRMPWPLPACCASPCWAVEPCHLFQFKTIAACKKSENYSSW